MSKQGPSAWSGGGLCMCAWSEGGSCICAWSGGGVLGMHASYEYLAAWRLVDVDFASPPACTFG